MSSLKKKNNKAYTLAEVLVVVMIIGILAAIAIPNYFRSVEKTRATDAAAILRSVARGQVAYSAKSGGFAPDMFNLPLDLKDKDGIDVEGSEFDDKFFDYTIYGSEEGKATAARKNGKYTISVDYETGEISCTPSEYEICLMLNYQ